MIRLFFVFLFLLSMSMSGQEFCPEKPKEQQAACCSPFQVDSFGNCYRSESHPWVAYGGGWQSKLSITNSKTGPEKAYPISIRWDLLNWNGSFDDMISPFFTDNFSGRDRRVAGAYIKGFKPNEVVQYTFLYPHQPCESLPCDYEPDTGRLMTGGVLVRYYSGYPEYLKGDFIRSKISFLYAPNGGPVRWQVSSSAEEPGEEWVAQFSETFDRSKLDAQATLIAVRNPGIPTLIIISLEKDGVEVAQQEIHLQTEQSRGYELRGLFGEESLFPGGVDFHGLIRFRVRPNDGGPLNVPGRGFVPLVFGIIGDSIGNSFVRRVK